MKNESPKKRPGRPKGFVAPKQKPGISISPALIEEAKRAAEKKQISLSELVSCAMAKQLARKPRFPRDPQNFFKGSKSAKDFSQLPRRGFLVDTSIFRQIQVAQNRENPLPQFAPVLP